MNRLIAGLLTLPVLLLLDGDPRRHVHAYAGHDHHEHHHGLASHEHEAEAAERDPHLSNCDPGDHIIRISVVCSSTFTIEVVHVELPSSVIEQLAVSISRTAPVIDERVHGPPAFSTFSLRAPPAHSA